MDEDVDEVEDVDAVVDAVDAADVADVAAADVADVVAVANVADVADVAVEELVLVGTEVLLLLVNDTCGYYSTCRFCSDTTVLHCSQGKHYTPKCSN